MVVLASSRIRVPPVEPGRVNGALAARRRGLPPPRPGQLRVQVRCRGERPPGVSRSRHSDRRRALVSRGPDHRDRRSVEGDARRLLRVRRHVSRCVVDAERLAERRAAILTDGGMNVHHIVPRGGPDGDNAVARHRQRRHAIQRAGYSKLDISGRRWRGFPHRRWRGTTRSLPQLQPAEPQVDSAR